MIPAIVKATATATATATPGDANWGFRCVLSALWKKRKAAHEAVHLVARAARNGLAPLCGRVAATKSGHCVRIYFLGVQTGDLVSPRKTIFFNILTTFWSPWQFPGGPGRRQIDVSVRFELPSEQTKSCPIRLLPWVRRWRVQSGTSLWPPGTQKSRLGVRFYFLAAHFCVLSSHGKIQFFDIWTTFWCLPEGAGVAWLDRCRPPTATTTAKMAQNEVSGSIFRPSGPGNMRQHPENAQATSQ